MEKQSCIRLHLDQTRLQASARHIAGNAPDGRSNLPAEPERDAERKIDRENFTQLSSHRIKSPKVTSTTAGGTERRGDLNCPDDGRRLLPFWNWSKFGINPTQTHLILSTNLRNARLPDFQGHNYGKNAGTSQTQHSKTSLCSSKVKGLRTFFYKKCLCGQNS